MIDIDAGNFFIEVGTEGNVIEVWLDGNELSEMTKDTEIFSSIAKIWKDKIDRAVADYDRRLREDSY